ncbi:MAG: UDP-N-acetylmuramoyl-L-alanine--D-glutamate ligase [Planctomycetota bacterium]
MNDLAGKRVTVFGLGRFGGGVAVTRWLCTQGAIVTVVDSANRDALAESITEIDGCDVTLKIGDEPDAGDFSDTDLVVASPAVRPGHPMLAVAADSKVEVTTEVVLFAERCRSRYVFGVTGTKGKSTTVELLARMLRVVAKGDRPDVRERPNKVRAVFDHKRPHGVWVGGNNGTPLIEHLDRIDPDDFVVLELSSFMLWHLGRSGWSPHIAVVTMIGSDHLDWHGSQEAYVNAKRNLVRFQRESDYAVVASSSPLSRGFKDYTPATVIEYGKRANLPEKIAPLLPGKHNRLNERAAYAAAKLFGLYTDEAVEACADFRGLPHRLELVHEADGVRWINDSIATIPAAAAAACEAFPAGNVIQIIGGKSKGGDETPMIDTLTKRAKAVLCIGETSAALALKLGGIARVCETLDAAVAEARDLATEGDVVLLSPGFASYDQFANFQERGDAFRQLAKA